MAPVAASTPASNPTISRVKRLQSGEGSTHCFLTKESAHDFGELDIGVEGHPGRDNHYYLTEKKTVKDKSGQGKELFEKLLSEGNNVEDSWNPSPPKPLRRLEGTDGSQHTYVTKESQWRKNEETGEMEEVEGTARYFFEHKKRIADTRQHGDSVFYYATTHGANLQEDLLVMNNGGAVDLLHQPANPPRARPPAYAVQNVQRAPSSIYPGASFSSVSPPPSFASHHMEMVARGYHAPPEALAMVPYGAY